ncbi:ABC transporter substrate-binding protein [Salipiger mucosus]|uniref:Solute-binding protein family 5 domain-containing protein n=1 Tax=Salipiger mucosus DSM 16094 TaxID=1123237 RepID=S9QZU8_9RHOB|nr:ABC transporter substrate-binding protein [Salipiger mucosus]EPX85097.1 hypothetical protein Salmuc_01053 [Salipiger mucosus DSM 16094]
MTRTSRLRKTLLASAAACSLAAPALAETMILASPQAPEGFDGDALRAQTQNVVTQVYENLVRYPKIEVDGELTLDATKVEPHLAESWTTSEDGKTWVFKLREGVMSPYGNELTADDVEWGWNKSFEQKRTGNFIARVSNVESVEAISEYEVQFNLSAPSSIFLNALTLYVPGVYDTTEVKKHVTDEDPWALEWMQDNTAGFGAYHLERLVPDDQAIFVANPNYFKETPYFDRVIYKEVPSEASRVTLLKAGQVHWIDRPSIQKVVDMQADDAVKVERATSRSVAAVRMNPTCEPFDDVKIRQAFNYAIDRDALNEAVFAGQADLAGSIVSPIIEGSHQEYWTYDYDPEQAQALLEEAGYDDSETIEVLYSDVFWHQEPVAIQVADMLQQVGVNAAAKRITASEMRAKTAPGEQSLCFFTWEDGPIVLDPVYSMYLMSHSEGVSNRAKFRNEELDADIDAAREELDTETRMGLMDDAQKIWAENAPWVLLTYPATFEAMAPNISGWVYYPDEHERWADLTAE